MKKSTQGMVGHNKAMAAAKFDEAKEKIVSSLLWVCSLLYCLFVCMHVTHISYIMFAENPKAEHYN